MSSIPRIVLNIAEFTELVQGRVLGPYRIGGAQVEILLGQEVGPKRMIAAVIGVMGPDEPFADPPEAREFLPRGNARKGRG